jgi:serine/threonine protein kinase
VLIGRYEVEGEVGRGGMGVVLRARAPSGHAVAVKLLKPTRFDARARFEREQRLAASLGEEHGFVPCLETGEAPQGPFIVMPFLEGGTLRDRLARGRLAVAEAIELGVLLATAIGRAHERGIVHRDLKPENILFPLPGPCRPLIADLGLARHYDAAAPGASQTRGLSKTGEARGTPGYMAPEQLDDARRAGPEADVFALGSILHECLTGEPALGSGSLLEMFAVAQAGPIERASARRPEVPVWLDAVLLRALAFEPAKRFADGRELARALRARSAPRRRARWLAALLGLPLLAGSAFFLRPRGVAATAERAEELLAKNDVDAALAEAQRALDADPTLAKALSARAEARAV